MKKIFALSMVYLFLITIGHAEVQETIFPQIEGWELKIDDMVYTPDNLWELINGAADVFLLYGFQDLHIGEYSKSSGEALRVELYRHSTTNNAFGIYASERMPDYKFMNIGTEGYTSFGALNFFAGEYYVKMFWTGSVEASETTMKELAGGIKDALNQQIFWPKELSLFPEENRIVKTEGFTSQGFLGYSFLNNAFTVSYRINNTDFKLFIINLPTGEQAEAILKRYFETIKYTDYTTELKNHVVEDPYNGKVGIGVSGNFLYGVVQADDIELIKNSLTLLSNCIVKK
ncbi:MAG: hypothetical protein JXB00_10245 [Bacteroidales bacterium]|nr:hypothetical protein [Bacteroidales bacterium]